MTLTQEQFDYGCGGTPWTRRSGCGELQTPTTWRRPREALMQMANANLNPFTEAKLDPEEPGAGPLLIINGEVDHTVPWAIANASYKKQKRTQAVTEIVEMPNRGHALTIDSGWREVAQTALDFLKRNGI